MAPCCTNRLKAARTQRRQTRRVHLHVREVYAPVKNMARDSTNYHTVWDKKGESRKLFFSVVKSCQRSELSPRQPKIIPILLIAPKIFSAPRSAVTC